MIPINPRFLRVLLIQTRLKYVKDTKPWSRLIYITAEYVSLLTVPSVWMVFLRSTTLKALDGSTRFVLYHVYDNYTSMFYHWLATAAHLCKKALNQTLTGTESLKGKKITGGTGPVYIAKLNIGCNRSLRLSCWNVTSSNLNKLI